MTTKKHLERISPVCDKELPRRESRVEFPGEPCVLRHDDIPAYARNSPAAAILRELLSQPSAPADP